jgi:Fe-S-cluster containining protein
LKDRNPKTNTVDSLKWRCANNCGACCHLDPQQRPDLDKYLSPQDLKLYLSMIGEGGWCIHFDRSSRKCRIYEQRPHFCRVRPDIFEQMYGVSAEEFDRFAIDCCRQQIAGVYGEESREMQHYESVIRETGNRSR